LIGIGKEATMFFFGLSVGVALGIAGGVLIGMAIARLT
jgi:hypothetical protein